MITKKRPGGRPRTRAGKKQLSAWVSERVRDAFEEMRIANRRTIAGELEIAMERHMEEAGYWPPRRGKR